MASRKLLKKKVKRITNEILNDCDYITITDDKNANKADKLMDEAVDFHHDMIARINAAKTKKDFNAIAADVNKSDKELQKKLQALQ